jgi:hypothetical protein
MRGLPTLGAGPAPVSWVENSHVASRGIVMTLYTRRSWVTAVPLVV